MKKFLPLLGVALAGVLAVIVIAGCGGGGTSYGSSNNANGGAAADATLGTARTSLGKFLVDGKGRTVYLFQADKPDMSNCSGACASVWPPLSANAKPLAKGGVVASRISTIKGSGGKPQLAYNGHPLYYYAGDTSPGATKGQGLNQFGAEWYVIAPNGSKIDNA